MRIAEQYLNAFGSIAKAGTTLMLPANSNDPASMVAQALSIYNNVSKTPLASPRWDNSLALGPRLSVSCHVYAVVARRFC